MGSLDVSLAAPEAGKSPARTNPGRLSMSDPTLEELLAAAIEAYERLTPEQKDEMLREQQESWVRSCVRGDMTDEEWERWS